MDLINEKMGGRTQTPPMSKRRTLGRFWSVMAGGDLGERESTFSWRGGSAHTKGR